MALCLLFLLACSSCALGLDPRLDISQYAHTSWKTRDGFTAGVITTIAQTPDGYLWVGTESGLYRFDGVRAVLWRPPAGEQLPSDFISALMVSRDGTLWIGTFKGLASWKAGKFTRYPELAAAYATALMEDREGTVWIGTMGPSIGKLCAFKAGEMRCDESGSFGQGVAALYQDHKGNLWVAALTALWRWAPGAAQRYEYPRGTRFAQSLIEDGNGSLLLATHDGLKQLVGGKIQDYSLPGASRDFVATRLLRSGDGALWIGTNSGLLHLSGGRLDKYSPLDGLTAEFINCILEDREGNLWVSTMDGLDRFRDFAIPTIGRREGVRAGADALQASSDGSVWVGQNGGLGLWANDQLTFYRSRISSGESSRIDERDLSVSRAVVQVANTGLEGSAQSLGLDGNQLWVSNEQDVFRYQERRFVRLPQIPGGVGLIAGDGHGNVWVANANRGLFHWTPTAAIEETPWARFKQSWPRALVPDPVRGGLWLGFLEGGVAYFKDGQVRASFTAANGLGDGRVTHLRFDSLGALWAATENGLSRIEDGRIATLTTKNGLPCGEVHWSMEDEDRAVWLFMPCGLVRIEHSELDAWVSDTRKFVKTTLFDSSDGVRTIGIYGTIGPHVTKTPDGRIWFAPFDGISVIDPRHLPFNNVPPSVHIEQITVDEKKYDPSNSLRLPARVRHLDIDYTALSLVVPEKVRFRVKLEGEDKDWRELVNIRHVEYTNLPPKHYRFRVMACNNSGVWNEVGDTLDFVIPPAWYQTNWFVGACVLAFLATIWGIYQLRVRQLAYQFNLSLEARVNERTRLARDLHDTLLQSFQGLLMSFQTVSRLLPGRPIEAKEQLDGAIEQAEGAIIEGRDAVKGLRKSTIEYNSLAQAIRTLGEELARTPGNPTTPAFAVAVEGVPRDLHPILRDEVYKIAVEALRNAFRHAQARQVEVEIRYDSQMFRMHVRDDGRGFDPAVLANQERPGHYGLPGMRERAKIAGGKLKIWSEIGAGTEVELEIPARNAYATPPRRSWMAEKLTRAAGQKDV